MFKSLRWRLQVWHALVLLVVLASFGVIVYDLQWKTRLQQVDADLHSTLELVFQNHRRLDRQRNREEVRPQSNSRNDPVVMASNGESQNPSAPNDSNAVESDKSVPSPDTRRSRFRPISDPATFISDFDSSFHNDEDPRHNDEDPRYYLVMWNEKGVSFKSATAPDIPHPSLQIEKDQRFKRETRERRAGHDYLELVEARKTESGVRIFVLGQSLEKDLAAHYHAGWMLVVTGLVILAAGTLGGGWLSARAIRPIQAMSEAAESISAQNLSQRINIQETDSELGNLAIVLNNTFDRLQSAFQQQQQFTADASHELRTPLSVIATHTELALARPRSNEDYRMAIEACQRASKRMRTLIDSLLLLARFDSKSPSLKSPRLNLEPLIHDCIELVRPLAADRRLQIDVQLSSCEVCGDWDRLAQVFTNLLSNAIRYNIDTGHVSVSARRDRDQAVVSVSDTGIGIRADQLPHIFERFFQVDKARSRAEGSCGLGLSICQTIVDAHRGTITASSEVGVGTTIEVRLPLAKSSAVSERATSDEDQLVSSAHEFS